MTLASADLLSRLSHRSMQPMDVLEPWGGPCGALLLAAWSMTTKMMTRIRSETSLVLAHLLRVSFVVRCGRWTNWSLYQSRVRHRTIRDVSGVA